MGPLGAVFSGVILSFLLHILRPLVDVVFPPVCLSCGGLTGHDGYLCPGCYGMLQRVQPEDRLYRETEAKLRDGGLIDGLWSPFYFERAGVLQDLVHEMKYGGISGIGRILGREIARTFRGRYDLSSFSCAIPVPLHRAKLRERGYNQAQEICGGIADVSRIPCFPRILVRSRFTSTQTALDAAARAANVRGAFSIRPAAARGLRGASVLLVDDVVTTGATIRSCAAALRPSGVGRIVAATIAIAQDDAVSR